MSLSPGAFYWDGYKSFALRFSRGEVGFTDRGASQRCFLFFTSGVLNRVSLLEWPFTLGYLAAVVAACFGPEQKAFSALQRRHLKLC